MKLEAARMRTITVVPYDQRWPARFEQIKVELSGAIRTEARAIEHIGSTAVPGLWAKPIIDIDVVIDPGHFETVKAKLAGIGYFHIGDLGVSSREAFDYQNKGHLMEHHLYVCESPSPELKRHLALRDYLRSNDDDRDRYSAIKIRMSNQFPHDIEAYMNGKQPVILDLYSKCGLSHL